MSSDHEDKPTQAPVLRIVALTAGITLLLAGGTVYFLGYRRPAPGMAKGEPTAPPSGKDQGKPMYWRSGMDPTEVYNHPGKDRMGMELVPVYQGSDAAGHAGTIKIDPATIQNMGVKTVVVHKKRLSREIRTVGRVAYNEEKKRQITLKISGWVERQDVNFVGQDVKAGQPLMEIYSPDLVSTQEEYLLSLRYQERLKEGPGSQVAEGADSLLKSAEARLRYWDITEAQIAALRERGEITRTMVLHAPFRGIITERNILEGGHAQAGQALYQIADLSTVWVYADVYEYEAPWLKQGQTAEMTLDYEPGATYHGKVTYLYPYVKDTTRTLQVRMAFPNSRDFKLKPDMWVNVILKSAVAREGLAIPVQSVLRTGTKDVALVALEGGRFEPREIHLGAQAGDEFQVLDGLKEGERVVTSAQFLINSESNLQSALSKMLGPKQEGGTPAPPMPGMDMPGASTAKPAPPMPGMKMPGPPPAKPSPTAPRAPGKE